MVLIPFVSKEKLNRKWFLKKHHHMIPYINRNKTFMIEAHWNIFSHPNPFKIDINGIRKRSLSIDTPYGKALILCPEDMIQSLIIHLTYNNEFNPDYIPRTVFDFRAILERYKKIEWDFVIEDSLTSRTDIFLYLGFVWVNEYLKNREIGKAAKRLFDRIVNKRQLKKLTASMFRDKNRININYPVNIVKKLKRKNAFPVLLKYY